MHNTFQSRMKRVAVVAFAIMLIVSAIAYLIYGSRDVVWIGDQFIQVQIQFRNATTQAPIADATVSLAAGGKDKPSAHASAGKSFGTRLAHVPCRT